MGRIFIGSDEPEADDLKAAVCPEPTAHLIQQRHISSPLMAEVEVRSDHHDPRRQSFDEHVTNEVLGRLHCTFLVEVQDEAQVQQLGLIEKLQALLQGRQEFRCGLGPHDLSRVTIERDESSVEPTSVRQFAYEAQHPTVPAMHTVERADRDDGPERARNRTLAL